LADEKHPRRFLPPDPRVEEPYRLTPQLALRLAVLGTLALALFAILFLRLWALQVLSGDEYLNAAQNNQLRLLRLPAPRGPVLDRNGRVLVENVPGSSIQIWPADLPDNRYKVLRHLSRVINVPVGEMEEAIRRRRGDPLTPVTVAVGVHDYQVAYIKERQNQFRGIAIADTYLRKYPYRALGAHLLGHVGEITQRQLDADDDGVYRAGDRVGQAGIEGAYDQYLRGIPGSARLRVDSLGRPRGLVPDSEPQPGNALRLTIDVKLQQAAERAIRFGIRTAIASEAWYANGGAIVALDPRNGQVLALASNPTFKPSVYVGRIDPKKIAKLVDPKVAERENFPGLNRVLEGQYLPGSTFKPVTALAALEEHVVSEYTPLACTPSITLYKQRFDNWDPYRDEMMDMRTALASSCDTYFYQVGDSIWQLPEDRGHPLQAWASRFGFGAPTGIDIGPEAVGLLPTPEWRKRTYKLEIDRLWKPGDSIQLAIGQKDLLVTPMQLTRFYALIANGGKLVTPHLALDVEQPGSHGAPPVTLRYLTPSAPKPSGVHAEALEVVRSGLYSATHYPNGTSAGVFDNFPVDIAGKTGTAEKYSPELGRMLDQSWFCGYGPADDPEIVVCALIENGGHGGTAAAPAARKVFEAYFGVTGGPTGTVYSD
jgi:penicillin-binding protein 2